MFVKEVKRGACSKLQVAAMQREKQNVLTHEYVPPSQSLLGMDCIAGKTSPKS